MRADVLKKVHETHLGIEKCKASARASMYLPGMTNDIEEMIAKCPTCRAVNKFLSSQQLLESRHQPTLRAPKARAS